MKYQRTYKIWGISRFCDLYSGIPNKNPSSKVVSETSRFSECRFCDVSDGMKRRWERNLKQVVRYGVWSVLLKAVPCKNRITRRLFSEAHHTGRIPTHVLAQSGQETESLKLELFFHILNQTNDPLLSKTHRLTCRIFCGHHIGIMA